MRTNNKYQNSFVFSVVLFSINRACYLAHWERIILPSLLCSKVATRYFSACNNRLCTLSCISELLFCVCSFRVSSRSSVAVSLRGKYVCFVCMSSFARFWLCGDWLRSMDLVCVRRKQAIFLFKGIRWLKLYVILGRIRIKLQFYRLALRSSLRYISIKLSDKSDKT